MEGRPHWTTRVGVCLVVWLLMGMLLLAWHGPEPEWAFLVAFAAGPLSGLVFRTESNEDDW